MIKIVADSSCDLLELPGVDFRSVPLTIFTDERSFVDDAGLDTATLLDYMEGYKGRSYTACPNVDAWLQAFDGADTVYAVPITKSLSGSYNAATAARSIYLEEHPQAKVYVCDTLSTGPELRLIAEKLAELTAQGLAFEQVCAQIEQYMQHTHLFYILQSLHNLSQNGRVSKVAAVAVRALMIRVLGTASPQGTIEPVAKCRGDQKALAALLEQVEKLGFTKGKLRITHAENPALAQRLRTLLAEKYPQADIRLYPSRGLCCYYGERGAVFLGLEA